MNPELTVNKVICPDCGRLKARDAREAGYGCCPKWWAIGDAAADADCAKAVSKAKQIQKLRNRLDAATAAKYAALCGEQNMNTLISIAAAASNFQMQFKQFYRHTATWKELLAAEENLLVELGKINISNSGELLSKPLIQTGNAGNTQIQVREVKSELERWQEQATLNAKRWQDAELKLCEAKAIIDDMVNSLDGADYDRARKFFETSAEASNEKS